MNTSRELISCLTSDEVRKMQPPFVAGYSLQLEGLRYFAQFVASTKLPWSLMAFGIPGTGKTTFLRALAHAVNAAGCNYGLAFIRSQTLTARHSVDEVRERLSELDDFISQLREPTLIVFDELDSLAPSRRDNPALLRLSTWAMDFLDLEDPQLRGCIVAGITNNPVQVEPAVRSRLFSTVYFELLGKDEIAAIIENQKLPHPVDVANLLWRHGCRPTGRGVVHAATLLIQVDGLEAVQKMSAKEVAEFVHQHSRMVSDDEEEQYESRHRPLINQSEGFVRQWIERGKAAVTR